MLTHPLRFAMLVPSQGVCGIARVPGKENVMKKKKNNHISAEAKERQRREAEKRRIFEEEGFTEEDIKFMSKPGREALLKKYGLR